jgi:hypothetical protein
MSDDPKFIRLALEIPAKLRLRGVSPDVQSARWREYELLLLS